MKQAILTFEKCRVLLVELPKGAYGVGQQHIYHGENPITYHMEGEGDKNYGFYFPGFVHLIGKLSELTEEQAREIVDSWKRYFPETHSVYRNYEYPIEYDHVKGMEQRWSLPFGKSVESFLSKLRADGYHTENPAGTYEECCPSLDVNSHAYERSQFDLGDSLTFSPDKTWVFTVKQ
ncbi:MAG: hypothetical protein ACTHMC_09805 [Pseudobacter sp.]|uniref:hypothetical protein n=1 Tax=Pseudobacter sp. TaxID=2045420 RepID=UPI003F813A82